MLFVVDEIAVCGACISMIETGEVWDDRGTGCPEDVADQHALLMAEHWDVGMLHAGSGGPWFSWTGCDGCGSTLGGGRHRVFVLDDCVCSDHPDPDVRARRVQDVVIMAGRKVERTCPNCAGDGEIHGRECGNCGGEGTVSG